MKEERILVILNPASGVVSKSVAASYIFKKLMRHFRTVSLINSTSPEDGFGIALNAKDNFDIIAVFGGDGTINSIASALVGTETTLGILPGGSGNGLIRNLNISLSWKQALETLIHGRDEYIDIGRINESFFFNVAGIGLDGLISKKYNTETKARGMAPYIYYALRGYFEMPTFRVRLDLDGEKLDEEVALIAFANFPQYGGNAIIAPPADPYDGKLDLCIIKKFKLMRSPLYIRNLFAGNIDKLPFYKAYQFKKVNIISEEAEIPSTIDGEYGGEDGNSFRVEVIPGSIKIRIPPEIKI